LNSELSGHLQPSSFKGLCGVVVTYHPSGDIQQRLKLMAEIVDELVIIDNSADVEVLSILNQAAAHHRAFVIANQRNLGVATALNQGVAYSQQQSAEWVLFFDQDSRPIRNYRQEMGRVISEYRGQQPPGIIGCNYIATGNATMKFPIPATQKLSYTSVNSVMTSGSMHRVEMFEKIGLFKDDYFIDLVDVEYCWRASRHGYAVLRTAKPLMEHTIGQTSEHRIIGFRTGTSNHSAFRRYFMARNTVLMAREYFTVYPFMTVRILFSRIKSTILVCLFERNKKKKIMYTIVGLWHGVLRKMDKYPEPSAQP